MDKSYFDREIRQLNIDFLNDEYKKFTPIITNDFIIDKDSFSNFWNEIKKYKLNCRKDNSLNKLELYNLNEFTNITKKIFLSTYASHIYKVLTKNFKKNIRVEELCYLANDLVLGLTPSKNEMVYENNLYLKDKEGIEKEQGILLSSILSLKNEGTHLCKSMLLPTSLALQKFQELEENKKVFLNGASIECLDDYNLVTLDNPSYLNAEDNRTLLPLEAAIDLAILDNNNKICVLRGTKVKHDKYFNKRVFGAGINLTHLYEGKIPYLWYITRDMGAVNKVLRGVSNIYTELEAPLFPHKNKIWFAALETFAIGGGCQYLLVMDHIIADKNSYMTLPARKEGIIPGAANLRLWRFVGNRVARQAIQHGLKITSDSINGNMICDQLININAMDDSIKKTVKEFKNSGVVGATFNKRALTLGEESIDDFRNYMAIYSHDQAYCHFSDELVKNLEYYWSRASN